MPLFHLCVFVLRAVLRGFPVVGYAMGAMAVPESLKTALQGDYFVLFRMGMGAHGGMGL